jgi:pectin methylesterase-like acyl-CoA thioesterase
MNTLTLSLNDAWRAVIQRWLLAAYVAGALLCAASAQAQVYDAIVAKDGTGAFTSVQAAVNAAPTGRITPYTIFIKNGKYKEKITIASNKNFLQFIGESVANTILTFDDYSGKAIPGGGTYGTSNSASVIVNASDFSAVNITFENTTGDAPQALAINVSGDRAAFNNCRFLGGQDTVLAQGVNFTHYFRNCYIDGTVDFIFGSSAAVFERCVIYPKTRRDGTASSYITAANTQAGSAYGYVFRNCIIPANLGTTSYYLGRPWQNATGSTPLANNKVVFFKTTMGTGIVKPEGWAIWDAGTNTSLITNAEYQSRNFRGGLVNVASRVSWSRQLAATDTAVYSRSAVLGAWNPCAVWSNICTPFAPSIAVTNFRGTKGATTTAFSWNASWGIAQVQYELMRSTTRTGTYAPVSQLTAANDTTYNFQASDALPAAGAAYYYYVRATKAGLATHISDTVDISRVPTITAISSLSPMTQYVGGPSTSRTYVVSGVNLTSNLSITAPASFEVSTNGTTWTSSLTLTQTNNAVPNTSIFVRLNASAVGTYSGNLVHSSTGATTVTTALTGTRVNTPAPVSNVLQAWSLRLSNQDSVQLRSANVAASIPTLRRLYVSNGTTVSGVGAYTPRYGQALSATANGDGSWGTAAPANGPGGTLSRRFYEQFTVTATGRAVRLDSLLLWSAFYNTNSNTKLAVVWSRSNFVSDSVDVAGGKGPGGTLLPAANGAFATPIVLNNQNTGANQYYRLSLADVSPVLPAGQTLTIRLYWSCGSSSTGRYSLLRDVQVKGEALTVSATLGAVAKNALVVYPNPAAEQLTAQHPRASQGATVTVFAFDGRKVGTFNARPGSTETRLSVGQLAPGNYLLLYSGAGVRQSVTITKE